jgi:hypothetical protein
MLVGTVALAVAVADIFIDGDWVGTFGIAATIIGLAVAVGQIRLARGQIEQAVSVAEATQQAVVTTQAKILRGQLMESIPHLQQIDRDLHSAVSNKQSAAEIGQHLADWRDRAYEIYALLEGRPYAPEDLTDALLSSAKDASEMRDALPSDPSKIIDTTNKLRIEMSGVCGRLGAVRAKLKLDPGEN